LYHFLHFFNSRFLYAKKTEFESAAVAVQIYEYADMMQMAGLVDAVTQFLQKETNSTNVFVVLDLWVKHEKQTLVEECLKVYGGSS
jgi:hypothetical protein